MKIATFDTTLRDGAQAEKISFSVADKIKIVKILDDLGVDYIEAGNPASNVKDLAFFKELQKLPLSHAKLVAFGSTRRVGVKCEDDVNLNHLANAKMPAAAIFGKAWDLHVTEVLHTTLEENLAMITESIAYLKKCGKEVIFDAEHFFDGYKHNKSYALAVVKAASGAGADVICLCDTNGGVFCDEICEIVAEAVAASGGVTVGIHTHNDSGMAVSNTILAVTAGARHVQGTLNGIGERCGNANLGTIMANLQLKKGFDVLPDITKLTAASRAVAEVSNISVWGMPYVSKTAFSHKAGMHIDGVLKNPASFEHVDPHLVGNDRTFLVSEVAGKSAIWPVVEKIAPHLTKSSPEITKILNRMKELEFEGYQFEGAPASLELEIRKCLGLYTPFFELDKFRLITEQDLENDGYSSAFIKVLVDKAEEITAADSTQGPVNAFDQALRKALERFYPYISDMRLTDYKVRVLNSEDATGAKVRVLIESTDGTDEWTTVGVSTDIIMASKKALMDSLEYKLQKEANL